jgi:hypothetical protein
VGVGSRNEVADVASGQHRVLIRERRGPAVPAEIEDRNDRLGLALIIPEPAEPSEASIFVRTRHRRRTGLAPGAPLAAYFLRRFPWRLCFLVPPSLAPGSGAVLVAGSRDTSSGNSVISSNGILPPAADFFGGR